MQITLSRPKLSQYPSLLVALFSLLLVHASPLLGADTEKVQKLPFHGILEAVDTSAQTISVGKSGRVFHLSSTTKITDGAGNPSTLSAAVVGEDTGGSYTKDAAGTLTLASVRFGAKAGSKTAAKTSAPVAATAAPAPKVAPATPPPVPAPAPAVATAPAKEAAPAATAAAAKVKKQTFSGKVVSVNAAANTLVIHGSADQTFTVTPETKITGAANLGALAVGTKVGGTYSKSADGATLTVYTLKTK